MVLGERLHQLTSRVVRIVVHDDDLGDRMSLGDKVIETCNNCRFLVVHGYDDTDFCGHEA